MATTGTPSRVGGYFFVCSDCMFANVNGEEPIDRPESEPEVWAIWTDGVHDIVPAFGGEDDEDDGILSFSTSRCDGCGSHLHGERYRFAWFEVPDSIEHCRDCGEPGVMTGHMECQYPRNHDEEH